MELFAGKLRQLGESTEHFGCGVRVAPVIILGNRRAVSVTLVASAHGDQCFEILKAFRCTRNNLCKIRHRSEGKNCNIRGCF